AGESQLSGGKMPGDDTVKPVLGRLEVQAPLLNEPTATADYASTVHGKSADEVYATFVNHAGDAFAAAGVKVRPAASGALHDGQRLMLEQPSQGAQPPVWAPIVVKLDPSTREVH